MKAKAKWSVCVGIIVQSGFIFYMLLKESILSTNSLFNFVKLTDSSSCSKTLRQNFILGKAVVCQTRCSFQLLKAVRCQTGHWGFLASAKEQEDR